MIDIISSSIRLGKLLSEHNELIRISVFFSQISNEKDNIRAHEYIQLVSSKLDKYGLYAFDVVDQILTQNLKNEDERVKKLALNIRTFISEKTDYNTIIDLSKKYAAILDDYIAQLLTQINDYPQIKLENIPLKIQQCSNELSTSILRSGVLSWLTIPEKIELLKKELSFINYYEAKIEGFKNTYPYNKQTRKIINSFNKKQRMVACHIENIRFVQYLAKRGIMQGFFFELYDIPDSHIIKIKETYKDKSIHPVAIKTDLVYPANHLFLFKYSFGGKTSYLLAKRVTIKFTQESGSSTTILGYCYPTNEYSLMRID